MRRLGGDDQRALQSGAHLPASVMAFCEAVEFATLKGVDWFNQRRLMGPMGNISPAEAEQRYYASLENPALGRDSDQLASHFSGAVHSS